MEAALILEILIQTMKNAEDRPLRSTVRGQKPSQARKTYHPATPANLGNPALNPVNPDRWGCERRPSGVQLPLPRFIFG